MPTQRLFHVLVISSLFPNPRDWNAGLFVHDCLREYPSGTRISVIVPFSVWGKPFPKTAHECCSNQVISENPLINTVDYIEYLALPRFLMPLSWFQLWPRVLATARRLHLKRPIDVVHAHCLYPDGLLAARIAQKLGGIPSVCTCHGSDVNVLAKRWYMRPSVQRTLDGLAALIFVSAALKRELEVRYRIPDRILVTVIRNGVEMRSAVETETACILDKLSIGQWARTRRLLLFVGGLKKVKRPDLLLEAFEIVVKQREDVGLIVVGEGPMRGRLQRYVARRHLSEHVRFLGRLSNPDVLSLMGAVSLLVISSQHEGIPMVLFESLSAGTPVVSTDVGGVREVLTEECGILTSRGDVRELASGILRGLERDWDREKIKQHVSAMTWDSVVSRILEVYRHVTKRLTASPCL